MAWEMFLFIISENNRGVMTIKEIARLADVSTGTVDRVIHNRGYVRADKKSRIKKIINDNDYKPNLCARNLKLNSNMVVGFVTPLLSSENGYWNLVFQGVLKAQKDLADFSYKVRMEEYDRNEIGSFTKVCDMLLADGIKSFIIIPKCLQEAKEFMLRHSECNFILLDSVVPEAMPLCKIGEDSYKGGRIAGRILSMMAPCADNILTFSFNDSYISKERISGFRDYYSEAGKSENIIEENLKSPSEIPALVNRISKEYGRIDGIFSPCSAGHYFGEILNTADKSDYTSIVTYDFTLDNKNALSKGQIGCILSQRPFTQGYEGVYQLYRSIMLCQQIEDIEIQVDIFFAENMPYGEEEYRLVGSS